MRRRRNRTGFTCAPGAVQAARTYFPSKNCLVLEAVKEDTTAIVAGRAERQTPLAALPARYARRSFTQLKMAVPGR